MSAIAPPIGGGLEGRPVVGLHRWKLSVDRCERSSPCPLVRRSLVSSSPLSTGQHPLFPNSIETPSQPDSSRIKAKKPPIKRLYPSANCHAANRNIQRNAAAICIQFGRRKRHSFSGSLPGSLLHPGGGLLTDRQYACKSRFLLLYWLSCELALFPACLLVCMCQ